MTDTQPHEDDRGGKHFAGQHDDEPDVPEQPHPDNPDQPLYDQDDDDGEDEAG